MRFKYSLLSLALAAAAPAWGQNISAGQLYDGTLFPDQVVDTLSHYDQLFPSDTVRRGGNVRALPRMATEFPAVQFEQRGKTLDLKDYLAYNRVAGLLVIKNGKIALEHYDLGIDENTRWGSFSMAKSVTSTLLGAAIKDGYIKSVDDRLTRYLPELVGGGYEHVTIRQLVSMASGVRWDETYTSPSSDRRQLLAEVGKNKPGSTLAFLRTRKPDVEPGTVMKYNTGDSFLTGLLIEAATKRPLSRYLSEKIWSRAGMEHDATWWTEGAGGAVQSGAGITATLRDFGRFGMIAANGGKVDGVSIVPENWFKTAGAPQTMAGKVVDYGYYWWIPDQADPIHKGAFVAQGIFGQFIYVNPAEDLVIVTLSARSKPSAKSRIDVDDNAFFAAVARALH